MVDERDLPAPKFGKSALELLDSRNSPSKSLSEKYGLQVATGGVGGLTHLLKNWVYNRPFIAGAYMYPVCFLIGCGIGQALLSHRQNYWAERDAVLRHYIELHPEDFVPPERKKYGDVLLEWVPIR